MTQPIQADASSFDDVVLPSRTHVPLTRARSNGLLLLVALIWGSAFVAQSLATRSLGSLMFTGARFALRARRAGRRAVRLARLAQAACAPARAAAARLAAHRRSGHAAVTRRGHAAGRHAHHHRHQHRLPHRAVHPAGAGARVDRAAPGAALDDVGRRGRLRGRLLAADGGGSLANFRTGDWWIIASSLPWAAHVMLVGRAANRLPGALLVACGQFAACAVLALALGAATEPVTAHGIGQALGAIVYTGVLSAGLAFTLQVVAMRHAHAHAADAAVVLSSETVFAAAFGAAFMGDRIGCDRPRRLRAHPGLHPDGSIAAYRPAMVRRHLTEDRMSHARPPEGARTEVRRTKAIQ